jgi:AcrR family transcriptional regulator
MTTDKRVERTQGRLREALATLILQRGYGMISIRDITAQAGVGYATFFRHYPSKDALLLDLLKRSIQDLATLLPPEEVADPAAEGAVIFAHAAENDQLYRILLREEGTRRLLDDIQATAVEEALRRFAGRYESAIPMEILTNHLVASIIALINWWLQNDQPYPAQRMGEIYGQMIMKPFLTLMNPAA